MINIKQATPADKQTIVDFQVTMAKETESLTLDPATVQKGVQAVFDNPAKGSYYLACDEDDNILAMLLTIPEWSDWRNSTALWIHSVYVTPNQRGKGLFKNMYIFLKQKVKNDPTLFCLRLYVDKTNKNAQKAYEKLKMTSEHYHMYEWQK